MAILTAVSVPTLSAAAERARARAAARAVVSQLARARSDAVSRGVVVAVRLDGPAAAPILTTIVDGNRNGILAPDITAGVDVVKGPPLHLAEYVRGVTVRPAGGSPTSYSFSPRGTASSGTLVIESRGGTRFAVRVLGATGRVRLLVFSDATSTWEEEP
jgi:Tfp pilus assembly protein FimT